MPARVPPTRRVAAIAGGDLEVVTGHRPDLVAIAGFVLSAPAEGDVARARWRRLAVLAVVTALLNFVMLRATGREDR